MELIGTLRRNLPNVSYVSIAGIKVPTVTPNLTDLEPNTRVKVTLNDDNVATRIEPYAGTRMNTVQKAHTEIQVLQENFKIDIEDGVGIYFDLDTHEYWRVQFEYLTLDNPTRFTAQRLEITPTGHKVVETKTIEFTIFDHARYSVDTQIKKAFSLWTR